MHFWAVSGLSIHCEDFRDLRNPGHQVLLDAHFEGQVSRGAVDAGSEQADVDFTLAGHIHQFQIAPVGLNGRPDGFEYLLDSSEQRAGLFGCLGHDSRRLLEGESP